MNDSLPLTVEEIDNEGTNFGRESKRPSKLFLRFGIILQKLV